MDFDFTTETITPDATSILTVGGGGAFELPSGATISGSLPAGVVAGAMRWNTSVPQLEYNNGSAWVALASSSGNVTSIVAGTNISVSGATGAVTVNVVNAPSFSGQVTSTVSTGTAPFVVASTTQVANLNATYAANLDAGTANQIPYQTAANTTSFFSAANYGVQIYGATGVPSALAGAAGVLQGSASATPTFTTTPTLTGTNFSGIPNGALTNSSITVTGGTGLGVSGSPVSLGGTVTLSNTGVTSITAGTNISVSGSTGGVTVNVVNAPSFSGQVTSTVSTGTAPFVVASTTQVSNLTAQYSGNTLITTSTTNASYPIALAPTSSTGQQSLLMDTTVTVNPSTNTLTGLGNPVNPTDAVNLQYLQSYEAGLEWKYEVVAATTADLGPFTYSNGSSGVGATMTNAGTQAAFAIDGWNTWTAGVSRVLVKNETATGTGTATPAGTGSTSMTITATTGTIQVGQQITFTGVVSPCYITAWNSGTGVATLSTAQTWANNAAVTTSDAYANGIYTVTTIGSGASNWVLTRAIDNNTSVSMNNATTLVTNGTTNANTGWTQTVANPTIGTNNITWIQFSGAGSGVSSFQTSLSGLSPSSATTGSITLSGTLGVASGGTGSTSFTAYGVVYEGATTTSPLLSAAATTTGTFLRGTSGAAPAWSTLVLPNAATTGDILYATASNTIGNLADVATGQVLTSGGVGAAPAYSSTPTVTSITLTQTTGTAPMTVSSTTAVANLQAQYATNVFGGTTGSLVYQTAANTSGFLADVTAGSYLRSAGAGVAPVWSTLTLPNAATTGDIFYASSSNTMGNLADVAVGSVLLSGGIGAAPTWGSLSTNTVTSAAAGTNIYISGTGTGPYTGAITINGPKYWAESSTAPVNLPTVTASQGVAIGTGATSTTYGVMATANGEFSVAGDAQTMRAILRLSSTTATAGQVFYLDGSGASQLLTLPASGAWTFTIKVVARQQSPTGTYGSWIFNGMIYRESSGTPVIPSGGISKTTVARVGSITGSNDPTVSAGAGGDLHIVVTPPNTNTIHWVADVELVQVI